MLINDILSKIRTEILIRAGRGFTWEVNAEITKYEVYTLKEPTFWEDIFKGEEEWTWKLSKEVRDKKYISKFCRRYSPEDYGLSNVDVDLSVTKDLENQLPYGINVLKKPNGVLYDGRNYRVVFCVGKNEVSSSESIEHHHLKHINKLGETENGYRWEFKGRKTCYIEGNRVYLTVSDDYANRIFNTICNSEYPFRNYLLEKHDQVLRDIALKMSCWGYYPCCDGEFHIDFSGVSIRGSYEGDGCGYNWDTISFEDFGLTNLKTYEQLYAMAIALIDTKKKLAPEWTKASFYISHSSDYVHIDVMLPPPEPPKRPAVKLKEW